MGFMKESYSNNRAGLLVTFGGDEATPSYTPTDSVTEALEYFNLYVENGIIYSRTETEEIYDELGVNNTQEVEEMRSSIDVLASLLTDETAIEHPILFKEWKAGISYSVGDRIRYRQGLYKVLTAHTSQADWTPDAAPSLFAILLNPDPNIIYDWIQPDSTNGYAKGSRVRHNGDIWTSTADNNVWEPGAVGAPWVSDSEEQFEPAPQSPIDEVPEWTQPDAGNPYNTGDRVMFEGNIYESTIDNNVWSPSAYPTGWQLIAE
jgi:hypothetical protein